MSSASCGVSKDWDFGILTSWTSCTLNAEKGCWALFWDHWLFIFSVCSERCRVVTLHIVYHCCWKLVLMLEDFSCMVTSAGSYGWHGTTPRALARVGDLLMCQARKLKIVRLFQQRRKIWLALNRVAVSSVFEGVVLLVLFWKMDLEKV